MRLFLLMQQPQIASDLPARYTHPSFRNDRGYFGFGFDDYGSHQSTAGDEIYSTTGPLRHGACPLRKQAPRRRYRLSDSTPPARKTPRTGFVPPATA